MNKQSGMGLTELLISLFLASIIIINLLQFYLINKGQYIAAQKILEQGFDLQWINELLSASIRSAGFTPCLGIGQLSTVDRRHDAKNLQAFSVDSPGQLLKINRMGDSFTEILSIKSPTNILVANGKLFKEQHPVLIADCEHAEVHQISSINPLMGGFLITLARPLKFSYARTSYVGEWLEESWFIKENLNKERSLYYKLFQTEELSSAIHSLNIEDELVNGVHLIKLKMDLDNGQVNTLAVAVRSR